MTDLIQSIDRYLRKANIKSALELQKLPYNVVGFSEDMYRRNRELKDFLYNNLYRHHRVVRMAAKAEMIISRIFEMYQSNPAALLLRFRVASKNTDLNAAFVTILPA